jgi:hypothetical protein
MTNSMVKTVSLPTKLYYIARMIGAFVGPPIARWSARPALPSIQTPAAFELGNGVTLWHLPVGVVRVREWHRELPREWAEVDDELRFPVMMSNKGITNWLDCTAWLPGIVENRLLTLQTYEVLLRAQQKKPTLNLFTHDPINRDKLAEFSRPLQ